MRNRIAALMVGTSPFALNAEGGAGGGTGDAPPPEQVLFGDENKPADPPAGNGDGGAGEGAADWKEYENDPAKSEAENAAAKAEHDKTKPAADDKDKNKDDPANKVPEDGKYVLKMPEGIEIDSELAGALGGEFKELGLTNAQAQKLTDKYIATMQAREAARGKAWGDTIQKWGEDAKKDAEIGGDKWNETVSASQRAVRTLGTPALREYLEATGGGNHPELIRFMAKVGGMIKEDNPATGGAEGKGKPVDPAHIIFANDAPKG